MTPESLTTPAGSGFAALRKFVRRAPALEQCSLCRAAVPEVHPHLVDLESRSLLCACDACSLLFGAERNARYKRVPRGVRKLADIRVADELWDSLAIPINVAFLFYNSRAGKPIAMYPSPAGATESALPLSAWNDIVSSSAALRGMESDVEALLVNRLPGRGEPEYFIAPVDECYKLVGIIRTHWRGLAGGPQVWQELDRFFASLRDRAGVARA